MKKFFEGVKKVLGIVFYPYVFKIFEFLEKKYGVKLNPFTFFLVMGLTGVIAVFLPAILLVEVFEVREGLRVPILIVTTFHWGLQFVFGAK